MATSAPSRANSRAIPRPLPRPPPVTSAVLSSSLPKALSVRRRTGGLADDVLAGVGQHGHHVVADLGESARDLNPRHGAIGLAVGQHARLERRDQRGVVGEHADLAVRSGCGHLAHVLVDELTLAGVDAQPHSTPPGARALLARFARCAAPMPPDPAPHAAKPRAASLRSPHAAILCAFSRTSSIVPTM